MTEDSKTTEFGARLSQERSERKMSVQQLAVMTGETEETIRRIESGHYNPSLSLIKKLMSIFPGDFFNRFSIDSLRFRLLHYFEVVASMDSDQMEKCVGILEVLVAGLKVGDRFEPKQKHSFFEEFFTREHNFELNVGSWLNCEEKANKWIQSAIASKKEKEKVEGFKIALQFIESEIKKLNVTKENNNQPNKVIELEKSRLFVISQLSTLPIPKPTPARERRTE